MQLFPLLNKPQGTARQASRVRIAGPNQDNRFLITVLRVKVRRLMIAIIIVMPKKLLIRGISASFTRRSATSVYHSSLWTRRGHVDSVRAPWQCLRTGHRPQT